MTALHGKVYVADTDNNCIQVSTAEREFLWMFWRRGLGRRQLNKPLGVAVDACDMVYVVIESLCSSQGVSL